MARRRNGLAERLALELAAGGTTARAWARKHHMAESTLYSWTRSGWFRALVERNRAEIRERTLSLIARRAALAAAADAPPKAA